MSPLSKFQHDLCLALVHEHDFYVRLLEESTKGMQLDTDMDVSSFWNQFWFALPDSQSIHRRPFDLVCDLAAGEFVCE